MPRLPYKIVLSIRTEIKIETKTTSCVYSGSQYGSGGSFTKTFNFSNVPNYHKLTKDNFIIGYKNVAGYGSSNTYTSLSYSSFSYDNSTGVLTVTGAWQARNGDTANGTMQVVCVFI